MKMKSYKLELKEKEVKGQKEYSLEMTYRGLLFYRKNTTLLRVTSKVQAQAVKEALEFVEDFTSYKKHLPKKIFNK